MRYEAEVLQRAIAQLEKTMKTKPTAEVANCIGRLVEQYERVNQAPDPGLEAKRRIVDLMRRVAILEKKAPRESSESPVGIAGRLG